MGQLVSRRTAEQAREEAIELVVAALWRSGLGKLSRDECRVEAERVIEALGLTWPCNRCDRVSGDGICWFHNV